MKFTILVLGIILFSCSKGIAFGETYYCQMYEPVTTSLKKKFKFKITKEIIHFLPEGHLAPGRITYMNENGPYFLAYIKYSSKGVIGELEFSPGNSFDGKHGYLLYSDPTFSFSSFCSKF